MNNISSFPVGSLAMASINVIGPNRKRVWFAYRAESKAPQDSGWVLHGPNEGDEFCSDPGNFKIIDFKRLIDDDKSLAALMEKPVWTCIERYADNGPWYEVKGFFDEK